MMNTSNTSRRTATPPPPANRAPADAGTGSPPPQRASGVPVAGEFQALALRPPALGRTGAAMAPRGGLPLASASGDAPPRGPLHVEISVNEAKREMTRRFNKLLSHKEAAREIINAQYAMLHVAREQTPAERRESTQEAAEKYAALAPFLSASQDILDYRASLSRHVAVRVALSDSDLREIRDNLTNASLVCNQLGAWIYEDMHARQERDSQLIIQMSQRTDKEGNPLDVSKIFNRYLTTHEELDAWKLQQVAREERTLSSLVNACNLPGTPAPEREAEEAGVRRQTGQVLLTRVSRLESRVDHGAFLLAAQSTSFDDEQKAAFLDGNDQLRLMVSYQNDIMPAFESAVPMLLSGHPVDDEILAVLEGILARLSEFASGLDDVIANLRNHPARADLPLAVLDQVVETAWMAANDALHTLNVHRNAYNRAAEPPPAEESAKPAKAATPPPRKKTKPKAKPKPAGSAAGSSAAAVPPRERHTADVRDKEASGKVLVRSNLGTLLFVDAPQAPVSVPKPPSAEVLAQLDELVMYDLGAQQRKVSEAYHDLSPENARYVVEGTIKSLTAQAADMTACLAGLEDRRALQLGPGQLSDVHDKVQRLTTIRANTLGIARSLQNNLAAATTDHMKRSPFPTEAHIKHLLQAGELAPPAPASALKGEPGTLFEVKLQPAPLQNGSMPRPIWLHIHTAKPVRAAQLASLGDADFTASHLKSDAQRGYNRQWQNARAKAGHEDLLIHRGAIGPALCRTLLTP